MDLEDLNKESEKYNHALYLPDNISYLNYLIEDRGLTKETINQFQIGLDEEKYITIPLHNSEGVLVGFKRRFDPLRERPKDQSKYKNPLGVNNLIFNLHKLKRDESLLIITEGEIDAISLIQIGIPAISQTVGKGFPEIELLKIQEQLKPKYIVIGFDNDNAGRQAMYTLAKKLKDLKISVKFLNLEDHKDWNEFITHKIKAGSSHEEIREDIKERFKKLQSAQEFIATHYKEYETTYLRTLSADEIQEGDIEYIVKPYIVKNGINLITAAPKSLKSLLTTHLIVAATNGVDFLGKLKTDKVNKVLLIDQENVRSEIKSRITKLGGNPKKVLLLEEPIYFDNSEEITSKLIELIEFEGVDLVVIDTLRRVNFRTDENSSKDVSQFFAKIKPLTTLATIIVIHHETKATFGNQTYYRGSGDIVGAVDSHISIKKTKTGSIESEIKITHEHSRYSGAYEPIEAKFYVDDEKYFFQFLGQSNETFIEKLEKEKQEQLNVLFEFIQEGEDLGRTIKDIEEFCKREFNIGQHKAKQIRDSLIKNKLIIEIQNFNKSKATYFFATDKDPQQLTSI